MEDTPMKKGIFALAMSAALMLAGTSALADYTSPFITAVPRAILIRKDPSTSTRS